MTQGSDWRTLHAGGDCRMTLVVASVWLDRGRDLGEVGEAGRKGWDEGKQRSREAGHSQRTGIRLPTGGPWEALEWAIQGTRSPVGGVAWRCWWCFCPAILDVPLPSSSLACV